MKTSKIILSSAVVLFSVFSQIGSAAVLYPDSGMNLNLGDDSYAFAGVHQSGENIADQFQFSFASTANIVASVSNYYSAPQDQTGIPLLNIKFLTLGLFDSEGNFITASGNGGTLSAAGLAAGETYTLSIFGKADGIFGGVYEGNLDVAVPLPGALPAFISALLAVGARRRIASK